MAYHTYEFLKRRKNDPKWRKAYTSARNKRIIGTLVTIYNYLGLLFCGKNRKWRYRSK